MRCQVIHLPDVYRLHFLECLFYFMGPHVKISPNLKGSNFFYSGFNVLEY